MRGEGGAILGKSSISFYTSQRREVKGAGSDTGEKFYLILIFRRELFSNYVIIMNYVMK